MSDVIARLAKCRKGATAIEYGLIVALIAIATVGAMTNFGNSSGSMWNRVEDNIVPQ